MRQKWLEEDYLGNLQNQDIAEWLEKWYDGRRGRLLGTMGKSQRRRKGRGSKSSLGKVSKSWTCHQCVYLHGDRALPLSFRGRGPRGWTRDVNLPEWTREWG